MQPSLCADPSTADRIRGNYENKIRFFSPPEKIFETFSTAKDEDNHLMMKYEDLLRALTPYNYCDIKDPKDYMEKWHHKIEKILHYADADNDGTISFTEFFFFITLLQIPDKLIGLDFNNMPDGLMTSA